MTHMVDEITSVPRPKISRADREFWLRMRQGYLQQVGAIEDMLGMDRTYIPKHKRVDRNP